jgi:hypothetical protein
VARKACATTLLSLTLLSAAAFAAEPPAAPRGRPAPEAAPRGKGAPDPAAAERRKGPLRLDEMVITGTPEHPAILFFLPRTKFRLLPLQLEPDWKERFLTDSKEMGDLSR